MVCRVPNDVGVVMYGLSHMTTQVCVVAAKATNSIEVHYLLQVRD